MDQLVTGRFACPEWNLWPRTSVRVVDWNIERGLQLRGIIDFLASQDADLLLLQEVDMYARRSGRINVAEAIARKLRMDYVFGLEFEELSEGTKASPAFTGQATLCRWPLRDPALIRFHTQTSFWQAHWWIPNVPPFQERRGGRVALRTRLQSPVGSLIAYNLHLESRGERSLRQCQFDEVLTDAKNMPSQAVVLVAGDVNFENTGILPPGGFWDAIAQPEIPTTTRRGLFSAGRSIDCVLVRGPVRARGGCVERRVRASDHYPLSVELER